MQQVFVQIAAILTVLILLHAAWSDLATRIIPDTASLVIALSGLCVRASAGPAAVGSSAALALVLFALLVLAHARGILGGGDVKLLTALAIGLPPETTLNLLAAVSLAGGVLAMAHLLLRRLVPVSPGYAWLAGWPQFSRICRIESWRIRRHAPLPYGVAIAAGGVWTLLLNFGS
jgi:prepilin peptidase CpaA